MGFPGSLTLALWTLAVVAAPPAAGTEVQGERDRMYQWYLEFASLVRGGEVTPHWLADGNRFWYGEGDEEGDLTAIHLVDPGAGSAAPLLDVNRLRRALARVLGHAPPGAGVPAAGFTVAEDAGTIEVEVAGRRFRADLDTYELTPLPPIAQEADRYTPRVVREALFPGFPPVREVLSPDRKWFVLDRNHDLWLRSTADGRAEPLTDDGTSDFDWRLVQDDQWNRVLWSPDSVYLAAFKEDRRGVRRMPVVHWLKPFEEVEWVPMTRAGGRLASTELWIVERYSRRRVRIDTGPVEDRYFYYLGWLPDSSAVLFLSATRDFKRIQAWAADPADGSARLLLREESPTFIKNLSLHPQWTELFTLLPESGRFLWLSERDGWDHLYLYDPDGRLVRRLTSGAFPVIRVLEVDEAAGWVYFTAHPDRERPYDTHLCRVRLDGSGFARLTAAPGEHRVELSPSRRYFLDTHSTVTRPPRVELRAVDGTLVRTLEEADVTALEELGWTPPEPFVALAADGETELHGLLYKPWDFDPQGSYPVLDHIYAGPHRVQVPRTFLPPNRWTGTFSHALAQLGYVVFMVDGRGTPERGKAFQDVIYRSMGRHEIPDRVAALSQVAASRPYMDLDRVGVFGSSWGGYMAVRAMLLAPEVYRVGVATSPVYDFYDHGATGLEGYMDLPQRNPEGYEYGSSLRLAGRLQGKLLLIHGTGDVNATFSATVKMVEALIQAGKPYDLVILPEQSHHPQGPHWTYRLDAHRRYFREHLAPAAR